MKKITRRKWLQSISAATASMMVSTTFAQQNSEGNLLGNVLDSVGKALGGDNTTRKETNVDETLGVTVDAYVPQTKFALLISNNDYPNKQDIPPAAKNLKDMTEALESLEFKVTGFKDLGADEMRRAIREFSDKMREEMKTTLPGGMAIVFYFCGHGFQTKGQNFLVPSGVDPTSGNAIRNALKLDEDVFQVIPATYPGITVALVDACRTDPTGSKEFNQILAPEGMLAFFSTRAGRPALAPLDPNKNTFFTEALVDSFNNANGVTTIDAMFQLAALRCQSKVKSELEKAGLSIQPQFPEATTNLRGKFVVRSRNIERMRTRTKASVSAKANQDWKKIQKTVQPRQLLLMCEQFSKEFPGDVFQEAVDVVSLGAKNALSSQRRAGLSDGALVEPNGDEFFQEDLLNAMRGDKDAAYRVARMYRSGSNGIKKHPIRYEQWLRFSAALGNGIASWDLAQLLNKSGEQVEATQYENLARTLGYVPPLRLSNRGY